MRVKASLTPSLPPKSPIPMASSNRRHAASASALPAEVLYDVLLCLPVKNLCRLRAVCRKWRSLLSDPLFAEAHAARHRPPPLLVASVHDEERRSCGGRIDIMDLSGNVVKRTRVEEAVTVVPSRLSLVCVVAKNNSVRVLDSTTGSISVLPDDNALDEKRAAALRHSACFAFGQVASTGEYKVVRVLRYFVGIRLRQLCEVFTLGGGCQGHWREKKNPLVPLDMSCRNGVVNNGVAYFLLDNLSLMPEWNQDNIEPGRIASFDLGTEEWSVTLRGPLNSILGDGNVVRMLEYILLYPQHSLSELNGQLVATHCNHKGCCVVDLWFLVDLEKGLWLKKYSIQGEIIFRDGVGRCAQPLLVLDEGRIVFWVWLAERGRGILQIYDPRTNTSTDVLEMRHCSQMGMFTGSPLCLGSA